jgi:hypothetical protein
MLNYVDETEMEEQGVGDLLLDENTTAAAPRYTIRANTTRPTHLFPLLKARDLVQCPSSPLGNLNGVAKAVRPVLA